MSTYRKIHGRSIQAVTTDPSELVAEGQVWYNTTSDTFKSVVNLEAFSSLASMGTGRYNFAGWAGSAPADTATCFGGMTAAPAISNLTEEFNGSGWAAGGNTNTSRRQGAGFGIQTAAVKTAGYDGSSPSNDNTSEEYNGTSWTTGNNVNPQRQGHAGAGTLTAGVIFGGYDGTLINKTEEYDGTNFSNVNNMNTARTNLSGVGTQTTSLAFGGGTPPASNATETYDGTNWTTVANMNTARQGMGSFGDSSTATGTGGTTGSNSTATETWDGTSWSTSPATLATARAFYGDCGCGSSTNGIVAGGSSTATVAITEEYNKSANVITAAAWASASNFPGPASSVRGFGTVHSASVAIGGETGPGPTVSACYQYDGSSWTSAGSIPSTARNAFGYGTQTAGLYSGGNTAPGQNPVTNASAEWDGSSWTGGPTMDTARGFGASSGVQTSALATGGDNGSAPLGVSNVESYNGSSWTTETAYPTGAYGVTGCGRSETTAFVFGGEAPYPGGNPNVATYNGSAWTTTATPVNTLLPANTQQASSYGEQDDCIGFGGTSSQSATAGWNGTAWSTRPSMGTGRSAGGTGISTDALAFCGSPVPAGGNKTEEFIGETSALNVKTLTQS